MSTYFAAGLGADEIKKLYRQLAQKHHPDHGGDTRTMQDINAAYAQAMAHAIRREKPGQSEEQYASMDAVSECIRAAIEAVIRLPGLDIEICGLWVWVGGSTRAVKEQLKAAGYRWAPKKERWYFAGVPARSHGETDMDDIRERYGSQHIRSHARA